MCGLFILTRRQQWATANAIRLCNDKNRNKTNENKKNGIFPAFNSFIENCVCVNLCDVNFILCSIYITDAVRGTSGHTHSQVDPNAIEVREVLLSFYYYLNGFIRFYLYSHHHIRTSEAHL